MATYSINTVSGGDYSSLDSAFDDVGIGIEANLTLANGHIFNCAGATVDAVNASGSAFTGATTTDYLVINGEVTKAEYDSGIYTHRVASNWQDAIAGLPLYTRVNNIQADNPGSYSGSAFIAVDQTHTLNGCVIADSDEAGLYSAAISGRPGLIKNTVFINVAHAIKRIDWHDSYIFNNTFYNCGIAISRYGSNNTTIIENNVFADCAIIFGGDGLSESDVEDYNAEDGSTLAGSNSIIGISDWSAEFPNYASNEFSLASNSQLIGAGTAQPGVVDTDIIGSDRPQNIAWDIGAFEYVNGGGTNLISCTGGFALTGSATLKGTGQLSASEIVSFSATANMGSVGTLSASETIALLDSATLTGKGELVSTGQLNLSANANLVATGALQASESILLTGLATLPGTGSLSTNESIILSATGNLTDGANTSMSVNGSMSLISSGILSGIGELISSGNIAISRTAVLTAIGNLAASSEIGITGAANLDGLSGSNLSSAGLIALAGSGGLNAVGELASNGQILFDNVANISDASAIPSIFELSITVAPRSTLNLNAARYPLSLDARRDLTRH